MTDYSKMSDFEINKAVAEHDGVRGFHCENIGDGSALRFKNWKELDYCNNPADAWNIILANKINIRFGAEGFRHEAQFIQYGRESVESYHENPLRAAMIVFLMMKEAGNV